MKRQHAVHYHRLADIGIFVGLLTLAILFRLPWFFQDVINWDESVFILVGDAWAKGHLPYTLVWDNKPPLGFAFFAFVISIVPDNLAMIRLSGAGLVAIAALFIFHISTRMMPRHNAFLSSALFIIAVSVLITDGMAVMMEHVAVVPMLGALCLINQATLTKSRLAAIGALLAAAAMVRTNLAYVVLITCLFFPMVQKAPDLRNKFASSALVATGAVALSGFVVLVYALNGHGALLFNSAIRVALAYSQAGMGYASAAEELLRQALRLYDGAPVFDLRRLLNTAFWIGGFCGILMIAFKRRKKDPTTTFFLVFFVATTLSILSSGFVWSHHLIQLAPFFAIGVGFLSSQMGLLRRSSSVSLIVVLLTVGFTLSRNHFYSGLVDSIRSSRNIYAGDSFDIANYLRNFVEPRDTLFATNDILLYWLLDKWPPIPVAAFPWNLWEEQAILKPLYGQDMTTRKAFEEIAARQPTWIVVPAEETNSRIGGDPQHTVPDSLLRNYSLQQNVSGRLVYRRHN